MEVWIVPVMQRKKNCVIQTLVQVMILKVRLPLGLNSSYGVMYMELSIDSSVCLYSFYLIRMAFLGDAAYYLLLLISMPALLMASCSCL